MRIEELDTPALTVDLDIMERNLRSLSDYCRKHGLKLRPHTKTHKIPAIAKMQIASGCSGITVAKVGEAEVMASAGLEDILIAYPVVGHRNASGLQSWLSKGRLASVWIRLKWLEGISEAATRAGSKVNILVEFDMGMRRCGVQTVEAWLSVAQAIDKLPGVRLSGLMFYPGHIWDALPEQGPALDNLSRVIEEIRAKANRAGSTVRLFRAAARRLPTTVTWFAGSLRSDPGPMS